MIWWIDYLKISTDKFVLALQASSHCSSGKGYIVSIIYYQKLNSLENLKLHLNTTNCNKYNINHIIVVSLFQCDSEGEDDKVCTS